MITLRRLILILFTIFILTQQAFSEEVIGPNVAGSFYPEAAKELSLMIDGFLRVANSDPVKGEIFALISPHAGYGYSGSTAAYGYKLIKGKTYKTVIVIGPSHRFRLKGISVLSDGEFRTPFGNVKVDSEFSKKLLAINDADISVNKEAFTGEHSLEVQLPFLQKCLKDFKIVPIITGDCSFATCQKTADFLKRAVGERRDVLVVASTDMYHGYDFDELEAVDFLTLASLKNMDIEGLYTGLREGRLQLCGADAVLITLMLSKELGHKDLFVLKHTSSAEVSGNKTKGAWAVGYMSAVVDQKQEVVAENKEKAMLNNSQKKKLLKIARDSIETYLKTKRQLEVKEDDPALNELAGVFVTLHELGQLRGCIGNMSADTPLCQTVKDMALESAFSDPRFLPVRLQDLKSLEIEISVLSPLEKISSIDEIVMGKHGVLVRNGFNSGVFLPQVATETGWTKEEFLSNLCEHKAGLEAGAWKDKATEIYIFGAEVFSEKDV